MVWIIAISAIVVGDEDLEVIARLRQSAGEPTKLGPGRGVRFQTRPTAPDAANGRQCDGQ